MTPASSNDKSYWKQFAINIGVVILLFVSALFGGIYLNSQQALDKEIKSRALAIFNSIVITRKWNVRYGRVFVEKTPGMASNPYLHDPDISASNGKTYTLKNPALMTREISEIAQSEGAFQFHITSLKPLNPNNAPDTFERQALQSFAAGKSEVSAKEKIGAVTYYRYMAPLFIETPCLECHAAQGYKVGDVRGGISIRFNITEVEQFEMHQRLLIGLLFTLTLAAFLGIVYRLAANLQKKLAAAQETIRVMSITDELTQLKNRRFLLTRVQEELDRASRYRHPFSCIFFDIDHFKQINDTYNHEAGDLVLKTVSTTAQAQCRQTDTLGRYGGEEFLMLLPETKLAQAKDLAERLRQAVQNQISIIDQHQIRVTITLGVACYTVAPNGTQPDLSAFIMQADKAMLAAKVAGRNRVGVAA